MNLDYGSFNGDPLIRLLCDGRNAQIVGTFVNGVIVPQFAFTDPRGRVWFTESGNISDGASIPPLLWPCVGGPFEGMHRDGALIHDKYCRQPHTFEERRAFDWMLYETCLCAGDTREHARRIYLGVTLGTLADAIGDLDHVNETFARVAYAPDPPDAGH